MFTSPAPCSYVDLRVCDPPRSPPHSRPPRNLLPARLTYTPWKRTCLLQVASRENVGIPALRMMSAFGWVAKQGKVLRS